MNTTPTDSQRHIELRAQRDDFVQTLRTALTGAGFIVTGTMPTADWAQGRLSIKSDTFAEFENFVEFDMRSAGSWHRSAPSSVRLTYVSGQGYRAHKKRYTKLNDELVRKLVDYAKDSLANSITSAQAKVEAQNDQAKWDAVRKEQLAGMVVPPGTQVTIITGNGSSAGKYTVSFERFHGSILDKQLTAEQVRKLVDVLNEIQESASGYVVTGVLSLGWAVRSSGLRRFWTQGYWQDSPTVVSQAVAEAMLEQAKKQFANPETVQAVPYVSVATI